jgi:hypothetical protein
MCWGCTIGTCSGKTCSGVISSLSCPWVDRTSQGSTPYNGAEWIIPAMHLVRVASCVWLRGCMLEGEHAHNLTCVRACLRAWACLCTA